MKIISGNLEFNHVQELSQFIVENNLIGLVQLAEPLKDKSGNVLIKENIIIKESSLRKLDSLHGQYDPVFKVFVTPELASSIRRIITKEIVPKIEKNNKEIINYLFSNTKSSVKDYKGLINYSFINRYLILIFYKLMVENREFFDHVVNLGLLCLGTIMQKAYPYKLIHRYAFLTGLFADVVLSETHYWRHPIADEIQLMRVAKFSSDLASGLRLPSQITSAIQDHPIRGMYSMDEKALEIEVNDLEDNSFFGIVKELKEQQQSKNKETNNASSEVKEDDIESQEVVKILTEVLKIARFITETQKSMTDKDHVSEKLLVMFTYNVEKGFFQQDIANPLISRFKEYDKVIKKVRQIASIENKCHYPPSAWAYPKPKATQVLCKNKVFNCQKYVSGWDIKVITAQEALGYIGTSLPPGNYPKCKLEEELNKNVST